MEWAKMKRPRVVLATAKFPREIFSAADFEGEQRPSKASNQRPKPSKAINPCFWGEADMEMVVLGNQNLDNDPTATLAARP